MKVKTNILWIDGIGGLIVGFIVLLISPWFSHWYGVPTNILVFTGVANLLYGSYSTPLANQRYRPEWKINLLIIANFIWTAVCIFLVVRYSDTLTLLGYIHILGEGVYVAVLAYFEWKWKEHFVSAPV